MNEFNINLGKIVADVIEEVVDDAADLAEGMLVKIGEDWKKPLEFEREKTRDVSGVTVELSTDDVRFLVQEDGMDPKIIKPRNGKYLAFDPAESDYPKTNPFKSNKGKGRALGRVFENKDGIVFMEGLLHPGIQKQGHFDRVEAEVQKALDGLIDDALSKL